MSWGAHGGLKFLTWHREYLAKLDQTRKELNRLITDAKKHGNSYFGILGGEPFMHPELLQILGEHPDCYLQIFTNGQLIIDEIARELRVDGVVVSFDDQEIRLDKKKKHSIDVVVDRLVAKEGMAQRLHDSVETALRYGGGSLSAGLARENRAASATVAPAFWAVAVKSPAFAPATIELARSRATASAFRRLTLAVTCSLIAASGGTAAGNSSTVLSTR